MLSCFTFLSFIFLFFKMQDFSGTGILYFEGYIHTMYRMESLLNSFSAFKRYLFLFLSEQSSHDIVSSSLFRLECPQNQGLTHLCNTHEHCAWHTCWITLPNPKGTFLLLNFSGAFDSRELTDHFLMFSFCICDPTLSCFFCFSFFPLLGPWLFLFSLLYNVLFILYIHSVIRVL